METTTYVKSINTALHKLLSGSDNIVIIGEDLLDPYGGAFKVTQGLSEKYPEKVFSTPISEAGILGIANGMALRGYKPIVEIMFGDFVTLIADQVINHLSKYKWMYNNKVNPTVLIRTPMGGRRGYGATHSQTLEKIYMGVPNIKVVAPSLFHEPGNILQYALDSGGATLFIENKSLYPQKLKSANQDIIGNYKVRFENENEYPNIYLSNNDFEEVDLLIFAYGGMVSIVEEAADKMLFEEEITAELIIPSYINSFSHMHLERSLKRCSNILIVEESSTPFGWGAELIAHLTENYSYAPFGNIYRIGARNLPIPSSRILENEVLPSTNFIINRIREICV
jgi:pyruvate/2-oxoglutarate/acetoin dehydrogenase E1 component